MLAYLKITQPAFKIAGGIILFLVSLDMLSARRQQRKRDESTDNEGDNLAIYPLAIPMLANPATVVASALAGKIISFEDLQKNTAG